MCFVWISEQTAIISLYSINWLVCITETECVYCAVRTAEHLNLKQFVVVLRTVHNKQTKTKPKESDLLSTQIGPNANTVWMMQWLVLPTCSRQLQRHVITSHGAARKMHKAVRTWASAAAGFVFLATKIPKERTVFIWEWGQHWVTEEYQPDVWLTVHLHSVWVRKTN